MAEPTELNQFEKIYGVSSSRPTSLRSPFSPTIPILPTISRLSFHGGNNEVHNSRFLSPAPPVHSPYSAAFLAAVGTQRTDLFYSELYKNLFYSSRRFGPNLPGNSQFKASVGNNRLPKEPDSKKPRFDQTYQETHNRHPGILDLSNPNQGLQDSYKQNTTSPLHGLALKSSPTRNNLPTGECTTNFPLFGYSQPPYNFNKGNRRYCSGEGFGIVNDQRRMVSNIMPSSTDSEKRRVKVKSPPKLKDFSEQSPHADENGKLLFQRPSSVESAGDLSSELINENRFRRRKRKLADTCPVCGVTVREHELQQHFEHEINRLQKISQETLRNNRRSSCDKKSPAVFSSSNVNATTSKKHEAEGAKALEKENRFKTFQKVRFNRVERLNARVGRSMRGQYSMKPSHLNYPANIWNGATSLVNDVICPLCNESLAHISCYEDVATHVANCGSIENDETTPSPEGSFDEYVWCGQTRVRATALAGNDVIRNSPGCQVITKIEEDSDEDLNVDIDGPTEFGPEQFRDTDLLKDENGSEISDPGERNGQTEDIGNSEPITPTSDSNAIILAMRLKLKEFENEGKGNRCLICMEPHTKPLVSVQCWHVHCEKCWLRALGVKKVCPQCNIITPASVLRTIYL